MLQFIKRMLGRPALPEELSYEAARSVLEKHRSSLERELAARADAEPEMLYYLADKGDAVARKAVAANHGAPAQANRLLADDVDADVRAELAKKVGRLLPDLLAPERERICQLTLETLQRLANDQVPRVRAALAHEIKYLDCAPKDVILKLARDLDEIVAVPILEYSPLLSDSDLLEIIATARAQSALAAVARRRGLSEDVSDAIVASLDIPAVAALLANPSARVREEALEQVVEHAEHIAPWHGPLTMRTDLSMRALRRIAGFVGSALLEQLASRNGLDDETRAQLNRALKARMEKDTGAARSDQEKAHDEAASLFQSGKLDDAHVEGAVDLGQRDVVIESLALLSGTPRAIVEKIFAARSAKAITALAWRAGLSMRTAFKIQSLLLKLHADELLPARAGVSFPMSEDEMRWHLSYFGVGDSRPSAPTCAE